MTTTITPRISIVTKDSEGYTGETLFDQQMDVALNSTDRWQRFDVNVPVGTAGSIHVANVYKSIKGVAWASSNDQVWIAASAPVGATPTAWQFAPCESIGGTPGFSRMGFALLNDSDALAPLPSPLAWQIYLKTRTVPVTTASDVTIWLLLK